MCCSFCHTAVEKWREHNFCTFVKLSSALSSCSFVSQMVCNWCMPQRTIWFPIWDIWQLFYVLHIPTFFCFCFDSFFSVKTFSWPAVLFELFVILVRGGVITWWWIAPWHTDMVVTVELLLSCFCVEFVSAFTSTICCTFPRLSLYGSSQEGQDLYRWFVLSRLQNITSVQKIALFKQKYQVLFYFILFWKM